MDKPKRKTFYKHCIVRTCRNNSTKSPGKAYIRVPLDQELRYMWMNAVGRKTTEFSTTNNRIYVCEDHFDLESDMENYLEWKLTGEEEIMKKTAVPRIIRSKGMPNESDSRELNHLLGLHEEISIKIEPPEEDPHNEVNVTVSNLGRDKSLQEETMSEEGLVSMVIESGDLVDCEKLKKQAPKPISDKQNINLEMNIQIKIKNIFQDGDGFEELAKSEVQSTQSDIYKKQILTICGVADSDESRDSSSVSGKFVSLVSSENVQPKQDMQECKVFTEMKSIDLSCEKQGQKDKRAKRSAAKRRTIMCPLCSTRIISNLPRHLERNHKDDKQVRLLRKLNPSSQERAQLLTAFRKRGYFRLKIENNLLVPVRASSNPDAKYFVCPYCLGHYSKRYLHRHVKQCDMRPIAGAAPSRNCLSTSQTFMAEVNAKSGDSISPRLRDEVFAIMRPDNISFVAKNDPLIRFYGDKLLRKTGSKKTATAISNKMREMSRVLLALRETRDLPGLMDALKPEMFDELLTATKTISGYNPTAKTFRTPSLAFHMGNNLRFLCGVALNNASDDKKSEIQQLKTLLHVRWSSALSDLIHRKESCSASQESTLTSDMRLLDEHIDALAVDAFERLECGAPIAPGDYTQLVECVLGKTAFFNRETVEQVQCLTLDAYNSEERGVSAKTLTGVEEVLAGRLKTVVCGDQGEGFVLIPDLTRVYIDRLLKLRKETDIVAQCNSFLFAAPGPRNNWMAGEGVLRKLARGSGAKNPEALLSAMFRNLIATTLQMVAVREEDLERLASSVGLRSPENIHQKTELARLLLEKRQIAELRGTNFDKTQPIHEIHCTESEDEDDQPLLERFLNKVKSPRKDGDNSSNRLKNNIIRDPQVCDSTLTKVKVPQEKLEKVKRTRISWSEEEKSMVRKHFSMHIRESVSPKKLECEEFLLSNPHLFQGRGWVQLKAFVYNTYRLKQ